MNKAQEDAIRKMNINMVIFVQLIEVKHGYHPKNKINVAIATREWLATFLKKID